MLIIRHFYREIALCTIIISLLGVIGCNSTTQSPTSTPFVAVQPTDGDVMGYPVSANLDAAYLVPSTVTPTAIPEQVVPEPVGDMGVLVGRVFSNVTAEPIVNVPLQLAAVFRQDGEGVYVLDAAQSPFAQADVTGKFVFADVVPGEYFLIVGSVEAGGYIIVEGEPNSGRSFFVNAGETTQVGDLSVDEILGYETTD